jgi:hypothetical protein
MLKPSIFYRRSLIFLGPGSEFFFPRKYYCSACLIFDDIGRDFDWIVGRMQLKKTVYKVAVGHDARATPARVYRVVAADERRAGELAREHSAFSISWPLGQERNEVVSEEGILSIDDGSALDR